MAEDTKPTEPQKGGMFRSLLRALPVAFSIYSKIPMPRFVWGSEDMAYHLIFFPFVGLVIGALLLLWQSLSGILSFSDLSFSLAAAAIPLLVTGGFHFDGYLDTMDALHSYGDREKKLSIMDDPHVGAFAVTFGILWALLYTAALSEAQAFPLAIRCIAAGFVLSRALSGIGVVTIPSAKTGGMLQMFARTAQKRAVLTALILELVLSAAFLVTTAPVTGTAVLVSCLVTFWVYRQTSLRTYQGITGDLAGFFVTVSELVMALAAALASALTKGGS